MQVVKRAGIKGKRHLRSSCNLPLNESPAVDKMEQMLGSYGVNPKGEPYVKNFDTEESPSGMIARSGTYNVRSRVVDDDGEVYAGAYHTWLLHGTSLRRLS